MKERLASVDVNANGNKEDGDEAKVKDGMNQNRSTAGVHVPKLDHPALPWYLKQQPWSQQHKEYHCN